jgi:hypothetical protein
MRRNLWDLDRGFWLFLRREKIGSLMPAVLELVLSGGVIVFCSSSVLAPFMDRFMSHDPIRKILPDSRDDPFAPTRRVGNFPEVCNGVDIRAFSVMTIRSLAGCGGRHASRHGCNSPVPFDPSLERGTLLFAGRGFAHQASERWYRAQTWIGHPIGRVAGKVSVVAACCSVV